MGQNQEEEDCWVEAHSHPCCISCLSINSTWCNTDLRKSQHSPFNFEWYVLVKYAASVEAVQSSGRGKAEGATCNGDGGLLSFSVEELSSSA